MSMQDNMGPTRDLQPTPHESYDVRRAKEILWQWYRRELLQLRSNTELADLGKSLRQQEAYGYGRRIFALALTQPNLTPIDRVKLAENQAYCTYNDGDLTPQTRFDTAIAILEQKAGLAESHRSETLGLAGAIYKRRWELDGREHHLRHALTYYRRGHESSFEHYDAYVNQPQGTEDFDLGYTGINVAYVLDVLADLEEQEAFTLGMDVPPTAVNRRDEAKTIRQQLLDKLLALPNRAKLEQNWWVVATIAEAYFGLQNYDGAHEWVNKGKALVSQGVVSDTMLQSTMHQLGTIARLQSRPAPAAPEVGGDNRVQRYHGRNAAVLAESPAGRVLREFLGKQEAGVLSSFVGKVGLALSGGGFRASLFHLGVLAKLAELDVLRRVEVLSCVSGGSIVGTHYYLKVRDLLQATHHDAICRQHYIQIVQGLIDDFLSGVQQNIRMQVAKDAKSNLKMMYAPNYSRTERVGELFEELLFQRGVEDPAQRKPLWLNDLLIQPYGTDRFEPRRDNWSRDTKVPILILNATSLNTAHNWQFTATWMGESPAGINQEIDANYQLRRMYHWQAPQPYTDKGVRLGHAVAASACVPGVFEPLTLDGLFPGMTVRLVDGGVHDNQGNVGLLEQNCNVILVSDASGQTESQARPSNGTLGVLQRSNNILMARVREAQYNDLDTRRHAGLLRGLMYVHLKKDLDVRPVDWIGSDEPPERSEHGEQHPLTSYSIHKAVQRRLAAIRTDLDTFTDAEAFALMMSGYRMVEAEFPKTVPDFPISEIERPKWCFLQITPDLEADPPTPWLLSRLDVSKHRFFKSARLAWATRPWKARRANDPALDEVAGLAGGTPGQNKRRALRSKTAEQIGIGIFVSTVGWVGARLQQRLDRWYLRQGKRDRFGKQ